MPTDVSDHRLLSQRLKHDTADQRERMHQLMARGAPLAAPPEYERCVAPRHRGGRLAGGRG